MEINIGSILYVVGVLAGIAAIVFFVISACTATPFGYANRQEGFQLSLCMFLVSMFIMMMAVWQAGTTWVTKREKLKAVAVTPQVVTMA